MRLIVQIAGFCLNFADEFEMSGTCFALVCLLIKLDDDIQRSSSTLPVPGSSLLTFLLGFDVLWQELLSVRKNSQLKSLCCGKQTCL